jgi:transcriptional regulator with XRE-family HTH domain
MIYPIQIRAARGLLGISQDELAERATISVITVKRIEAAGTELKGTAQTMACIQQALESKGIVFIDQDDKLGPGVRLKKPLR